mgnify:CR=1 FL=1
MIYLGSKNRLSKHLAPIIQSYIDKGCKGYLEPFVGGANMIDKIECNNKIGSDVDKYVIATLQGLQDGVEPPKEVSRELYDEVKNNKDDYSDFLVGYIGYEMSFGAKWFGGYVKRDDKKFHGDIYSYKSCMKQAPLLKGISFKCCSYEDYKDLSGYVIYCDPPYAGTTPYKQKFDYNKFYDWCREVGKRNTILISEYSMPDDFECIWSKETMVSLDSNKKESDKNNIRVEKLFTYKI